MTCNFRKCQNELGDSPTFKLCDTCRILDNSERLMSVLDPTYANRPRFAVDNIEHFITQMTGEEFIRLQSNLEFVYLEVCKRVLLYKPTQAPKRVKLTLVEQIEQGRASVIDNDISAKRTKKKSAARLTAIARQMNALGCSEDCRGLSTCTHEAQALRIFDMDLGGL